MNLYQATSIIKSKKWGDLTVHWFVWKRPDQRDVDSLGLKSLSQREFVDECFSDIELEELRKYLKDVHGDEIKTNDVDFPIPEDIMPYRMIGEGGGDRLVFLSNDADYPLPFDIWGHYSLFEHTGPQDDPDFDILITNDLVQTAGGTPIGVSDGEIPIEMLIQHLQDLNRPADPNQNPQK